MNFSTFFSVKIKDSIKYFIRKLSDDRYRLEAFSGKQLAT